MTQTFVQSLRAAVLTHTIIAHRGDQTYRYRVAPKGRLSRVLDLLMLDLYTAEGGAFEQFGLKAYTPVAPIRYLAYDADGQQIDRCDERTAAEMGLSEETHVYLMLPEEMSR